jgi:hypothetical protein
VGSVCRAFSITVEWEKSMPDNMACLQLVEASNQNHPNGLQPDEQGGPADLETLGVSV